MPTLNIDRTLAAARARVAALEKKAAVRNRELASLPRKYGYVSLSGLVDGINAARLQLGSSANVKTRPLKGGVKGKAKPGVAEATSPMTTLTVVKPVPADVIRLPSALRKAAGEVVRVKVTPALMEKIRELTEKKKTVAYISMVTGLGASTLFRARAKMGLRSVPNQTATVVGKAMPPVTKKHSKKVSRKADIPTKNN